MFVAALSSTAKTCEQSKCLSTGKWIKHTCKKNVYIYICILFSHKIERNIAMCKKMNKAGGHYSK